MTDPMHPYGTMEDRKSKLRAVSDAHEEWVGEKEDAEVIPPPEEYESEYGDANQFAGDALLPQDDFVGRVEKKTQEATAVSDPLDKAVEGLQALIDAIRATKG